MLLSNFPNNFSFKNQVTSVPKCEAIKRENLRLCWVTILSGATSRISDWMAMPLQSEKFGGNFHKPVFEKSKYIVYHPKKKFIRVMPHLAPPQ